MKLSAHIFFCCVFSLTQVSVFAQTFGSPAVEGERLKDLSVYAEKLRSTTDLLQAEKRNIFVASKASGVSEKTASVLLKQSSIIERYSDQLEDTLGASNVLFASVAIAMNIDSPNKEFTIAHHLNTVCSFMPGRFDLSDSRLLNIQKSTLQTYEKSHLSTKQFDLISSGLSDATSLKSAIDKLCLRSTDPKNWIKAK